MTRMYPVILFCCSRILPELSGGYCMRSNRSTGYDDCKQLQRALPKTTTSLYVKSVSRDQLHIYIHRNGDENILQPF